MKLFALITSISVLAVIAVMSVFIGLAAVFFTATSAEEYSPLDFIADCDRFEVVVGADRENGRYATYRYEFAD